MLGRHLLGGPAKIGVGANRAAVAAAYFEKYGYVDPRSSTSYQRLRLNKVESHLNSEKVGAVILDDGMQVLSCAFCFFSNVGMQPSSMEMSRPTLFSPVTIFIICYM